jgi:hypothetical protein
MYQLFRITPTHNSQYSSDVNNETGIFLQVNVQRQTMFCEEQIIFLGCVFVWYRDVPGVLNTSPHNSTVRLKKKISENDTDIFFFHESQLNALINETRQITHTHIHSQS